MGPERARNKENEDSQLSVSTCLMGFGAEAGVMPKRLRCKLSFCAYFALFLYMFLPLQEKATRPGVLDRICRNYGLRCEVWWVCVNPRNPGRATDKHSSMHTFLPPCLLHCPCQQPVREGGRSVWASSLCCAHQPEGQSWVLCSKVLLCSLPCRWHATADRIVKDAWIRMLRCQVRTLLGARE